ncbi:5504_t:CDS:2 [Racocetra fulgida]|uniref:5504_t:CDS:1 n=1 Tax=Racocetra fulgida TaxID=60492 RepID=A0A9N9AVX4_9GLOM|nr:5504_t:CDS:2 [Racocetra fulgida]
MNEKNLLDNIELEDEVQIDKTTIVKQCMNFSEEEKNEYMKDDSDNLSKSEVMTDLYEETF